MRRLDQMPLTIAEGGKIGNARPAAPSCTSDMPSPAPHVRILMATLNGARHLEAQLASIAAQTHRDWSLWVSDDGSTDDTLRIVEAFGRHHPVRLVAGPRRGTGAQNFLSLLNHPDLPPGPVALADQDDVWLKGKLARALRRMARASEEAPSRPVLYAAESMLTDDTLRRQRISRASGARAGFANALVQNLFGGHTTVINAEALALIRKAGAPSGVGFHDWWIYQLVAGAGGGLVLDPWPMALYRQHGGNELGASGGVTGAQRRMQMLLRRDFRRIMAAQADALAEVAGLLTPEAQATLAAFRAAPASGPGRVAMLRRLGIVRASHAGTAAFLTAALLGRM